MEIKTHKKPSTVTFIKDHVAPGDTKNQITIGFSNPGNMRLYNVSGFCTDTEEPDGLWSIGFKNDDYLKSLFKLKVLLSITATRLQGFLETGKTYLQINKTAYENIVSVIDTLSTVTSPNTYNVTGHCNGNLYSYSIDGTEHCEVRFMDGERRKFTEDGAYVLFFNGLRMEDILAIAKHYLTELSQALSADGFLQLAARLEVALSAFHDRTLSRIAALSNSDRHEGCGLYGCRRRLRRKNS